MDRPHFQTMSFTRFLGPSFSPSYSTGLSLIALSGLMPYDRVAKAAAVVAEEVYTPTYIPAMSAENTAVTLDAHHATLPRHDVIWARPATVEDDSQNLRYRPAGRGSMAVRALNRRAKYGVEIGTTKGTPNASPSVPTIPTNAGAIAVCVVPATSGNVTVTDVRRQSSSAVTCRSSRTSRSPRRTGPRPTPAASSCALRTASARSRSPAPR
jgi:hypothetical protein